MTRTAKWLVLAAMPLWLAERPACATKMYWTDTNIDKVQRADLDGMNVQSIISDGLISATGIAVDPAGGKVYWSDTSLDKIMRADLDGSNVEDVVSIAGISAIQGVALDVARDKIYWTDSLTGKIQRADLDGLNVEDVVTGLSSPTGIALDVIGRQIFWTDSLTRKVQRADLDGSNVQDLVTGLGSPTGIDVDLLRGKVYWTDTGTDLIQRADFNGGNVQNVVAIVGSSAIQGLAVDVAGGRIYWTDTLSKKIQSADLDGANITDLIDMGLDFPREIALDVIPGSSIAIPVGMNVTGNVGNGSTTIGGVDVSFADVTTEGIFTSEFFQPAGQSNLANIIDAAAVELIDFGLPTDPTQLWRVAFTGLFNGDITLVLGYDEANLLVSEELLRIQHFVGGVWIEPANQLIDVDQNTITVMVGSLSPFVLSAVPEPSAWILAAVGLFGLIAIAWRSRRAGCGSITA